MEGTLMDASTFLHQFYHYANEGFIGVTYLAPEGLSLYPRSITHFAPLPLRDELDLSHVHEMNARGYSVYFRVMVQSKRHDPVQTAKGVYYPRGAAEESAFTRVLWGEVDFKDADEATALTAIKAMEYPPSLIVRSGGGFHLYWLLNEVVCINGATYTGDRARSLSIEADELKRTLKGIAVAIGCADSSVADIARIMRLPDTVNTKPARNGARCEVVSKIVQATYDYRTLEMAYAPLIKPVIVPTRDLPTPKTEGIPDFAAWYLRTPAPEGNRNKWLFTASRNYCENGLSMSQAFSDLSQKARADGLEDHEIETAISQGFKYSGTPQAHLRNRRVAARDRGMVSE